MKELMFYDRCFWCLEDYFSYMEGVVATEVGYANGNEQIVPEYHAVGDGQTGYEEVVRVFFDETKLSVSMICHAFLMHLNPEKIYTDTEKQLRENQSKILWVDFRDQSEIEEARDEIQHKYGNHLLTKIEPLKIYYQAEEEHQHYFKKHPEEAACSIR